MALSTVLTESRAGDLARRAGELAREIAAVRAQMSPADDFLVVVDTARQRSASIAKALRQIEAALVKARLEVAQARLAQEITDQDAIING